MQWDDVEPERLFEAIRSRGTSADAERTVWAFERALAVARLDPELVRHLLIAAVCIVAYEDGTSPRRVLSAQHFVRRRAHPGAVSAAR